MEVNVLEHINTETGEFKDSFKEQIPAIAGKEFEGTKLFDQIKNLNNLVKTYAHTQKAYDTKMKDVIKRPSDDASDEDKAKFRDSLHKILGRPDKADEYEFAKPEDMPEGASYDEDAEKVFRGIFHKHGLSKEGVNEIVDAHNQITRKRVEGHVKNVNDKFDADADALKNDWKGDSMVANARIAYNAMNEFMKVLKNEDFLKVLKDSKIYDNAGDLSKWREIDVLPRDLRLWNAIGTKMKSPDASDEGGEPGKTTPEKYYDHPTSKRLFVK